MRTHVLILIVIFSFTLLYSLYHLTDSPRTWFDEGLYLHIAKQLATVGSYNFQLSPGAVGDMSFISVGYPLLFPLAAVFKLFGATITTARLLMVAYVVGFVGVTYLFVGKLYGKWYALGSVALLATFSPLYGNGKNVLGEVPGLFYMVLGCYFLTRAQHEHWRMREVIFAMVFLGLAAATKPQFLTIIGGLCVVLVYMLIAQKRTMPGIGTVVPAVVALSTPVAVWIATQFSRVTPWKQLFLHYGSPSGELAASSAVGNLVRFATELTPIHFATLFVVVVTAALLRIKTLKIAEVVLLTVIIVLTYSYIKTAGWYRYLFIPHALLLLLVPFSLHTIISRVSLLKRASRVWAPLLVAALLISQSVRLWTHGNSLYYPAWRQARERIERAQMSAILFFNVPEGAFFSRTQNFYQTIRIRQGLEYGFENVKKMERYDMIVVRDSDVDEVRTSAPGFREDAHIGNYYFFVR